MNIRIIVIYIIILLIPFLASSQSTAIDSLAVIHAATAENSGKIQQEMIYLHLDNTSYYRGDRIFFACYLVTSGKLKPSNLSKTVYVELLNPNGKIIDRCVLRPENGRCHGSLFADETPFYSGYYEIRAYTRYMLNFGQQAMYSRVIPIFAKPKVDGDWSDRRMLKYGSAKHQFTRPKPVKISIDKPHRDNHEIAIENDKDSIFVTVSTPKNEIIGASLTCRGELYSRAILDFETTDIATFKVARNKLPSGVIQLTLFDVKGTELAKRLFFSDRGDIISMDYSFDKEHYKPYEPVELTVKVSKPVPFSLSVTDGAEHVSFGSDIRSDLLIGSEIRGFIPNLGNYLPYPDSLLMAKGRYGYSWSQLAGIEPPHITHMPEQGIEVHGSVQSPLLNKGKAGIRISMLLNNMGRDSLETFIEEFETDSLGEFAFRGDLYGDWTVTLVANKQGKNKRSRNRILLDRSKRPEARAYDIAEMQYALSEMPVMLTDSVDSDEEFIKELERKGVKRLKEVEVTANGGHAADVRQFIENAVTSYDIAAARSLLQDQGKKFIRRVSDIMPLIDPKFIYDGNKLKYGTKQPIYVIDNDLANNRKVLEYSDIDSSNPADLSVDMVKRIYVNTQPQAITEYGIKYLENSLDLLNDTIPEEIHSRLRMISPSCDRDLGNRDIKSNTYQLAINYMYGCVLFIELNTNNSNIIKPGMRRSIIEGYSDCEAFQHADYHAAPPVEPDYRRTLYWNPTVIPDENGIARIRFYNNGSATSFSVTASCISIDGEIGSLR